MPAIILLFWNYSHEIGHLLFPKLCWHIRCRPTCITNKLSISTTHSKTRNITYSCMALKKPPKQFACKYFQSIAKEFANAELPI